MVMLIAMLMLSASTSWAAINVNVKLATVEMEKHAQLHVHQRVHMAAVLHLIHVHVAQGGLALHAVRIRMSAQVTEPVTGMPTAPIHMEVIHVNVRVVTKEMEDITVNLVMVNLPIKVITINTGTPVCPPLRSVRGDAKEMGDVTTLHGLTAEVVAGSKIETSIQYPVVTVKLAPNMAVFMVMASKLV